MHLNLYNKSRSIILRKYQLRKGKGVLRFYWPISNKSTILFGLFCLVTIFSLAFYWAPADGRAATQLAEETGDGWETAPLTEAGVNVAAIAGLVGAIRGGAYKDVHAILLVRGGRLILKEYFQGYNRKKPHQIRSATKSIGSVLVGIAIDKGYLPGVKKPIHPYFKDQTAGWDDRAKAVTIKSLLTMTSGFDCDDHRGESFQCEKVMYRAEDWVNFALNLPMAHQPGDHWAYNSSSLILLSEIIARTTGLPAGQAKSPPSS
jgi:CubicO group peptidase (beta-lactamase class C family)